MVAGDLKSMLRDIVDAGYAVPASCDPYELAVLSLDALGSPDPVLRDELAYGVLGEWIYAGVLADAEVEALVRRVQADDMLFAGIGESGTDSVFRRSFALLILAVALERDIEHPFLGEPEWRDIVGRLAEYCRREEDLRAHLPDKGWAHAAAHAADVADGLVRGAYATPSDCEHVCQALADLVNRASEVFQGEEDERVAIALVAMISSGKVDPVALGAWLLRQAPADARSLDGYARRVNWKLIARSVFFRLAEDDAQSAAAFRDVERQFAQF